MTTLLAKHEPPPFVVERGDGSSEFFLTCDHASNRIPESLASLGLPGGELQRHIAWDIGAAEVARHLSKRLDATLVLQNYSRLVVELASLREDFSWCPISCRDWQFRPERSIETRYERKAIQQGRKNTYISLIKTSTL